MYNFIYACICISVCTYGRMYLNLSRAILDNTSDIIKCGESHEVFMAVYICIILYMHAFVYLYVLMDVCI
jgi:hypothetical protein